MYTPLRDVRSCVTRREPFAGNNVFAEKRGHIYAVYSYEHYFPILANIAGMWFENSTKISRTTSRHLSSARPFHVEPTYLPVDDMVALLDPRTPQGSAMALLAQAVETSHE